MTKMKSEEIPIPHILCECGTLLSNLCHVDIQFNERFILLVCNKLKSDVVLNRLKEIIV